MQSSGFFSVSVSELDYKHMACFDITAVEKSRKLTFIFDFDYILEYHAWMKSHLSESYVTNTCMKPPIRHFLSAISFAFWGGKDPGIEATQSAYGVEINNFLVCLTWIFKI